MTHLCGLPEDVWRSVVRLTLAFAHSRGIEPTLFLSYAWEAAVRAYEDERRGPDAEGLRWVTSKVRWALADALRKELLPPRRAYRAGVRVQSLDQRSDDWDSTDNDYARTTPALRFMDQELVLECRELIVRLRGLEFLPTREREVVIRTVLGHEKLEDVAVAFGVSAPRASQLRTRAMQRIREHALTVTR